MGGGGMGPISVTPIGGSGRSARLLLLPPLFDAEAPFDDSVVLLGAGTVTEMTGDRFCGCDPTVILVVVVTVDDEVIIVIVVDDVAVGDAVATEMIGNVAARPGNFDMTDGDPDPLYK